jgi:acyl transferase domain-containing protein
VPTSLLTWPTKGLRRASINSFGYGGTNAHCIIDDALHYMKVRGIRGVHNTLEDAAQSESAEVAIANGHLPNGESEPLEQQQRNGGDRNAEPAAVSDVNGTNGINGTQRATGMEKFSSTPQLLTWTSHDQAGAARQAANLVGYLAKQSEKPKITDDLLRRLAVTLSEHRTRLPWMSYAVVPDLEDAVALLENSAPPKRLPPIPPELVFVFTGQGAQWPQMCRELLIYDPFKNSIHSASAYLRTLGCSWDLLEEIMAEEHHSRIHEPSISQPACTAIQLALIDLLAAWNVRPSAVLGHSSGEIAAAYSTGAISAQDACAIAYHRGRLTEEMAEPGAMMAVGAGEETVRSHLSRMPEPKPTIACINSPVSLTLSGPVESLDTAETILSGLDISCKRLHVRAAYHSPAMKAVALPYLDALADLVARNSSAEMNVRMFSSVTGKDIGLEELSSPQYWIDNMVSPVRFDAAVDASLRSMSPEMTPLFLEIGPHGALQGPLKQIFTAQGGKKREISHSSVIVRKKDAVVSVLTTVADLLQRGIEVNVLRANNPVRTIKTASYGALVDLPPYRWNRSVNYSSPSPAITALLQRKEPRHDLLGAPCPLSSSEEPRWRNYLRFSEIPWLKHHKIQGSILFPFSGMLAMAVEAARQAADPSRAIRGFELRDVIAGTALILSEHEDEAKETLLQLRPWRSGSRALTSTSQEFSLSSRDRQGTWTVHSVGLVAVHYEENFNTDPTFTNEDSALARAYHDKYQSLRSARLQEDKPARFYESFALLGSDWGPTFRPITEMWHKDSQAICTLEIPDTQSWMPMNHESPNVIHPATLDGIFQMLMAPAGKLDIDRPGVPKAMERVYISQKLPRKAGELLYGFSEKTEEYFNEMTGSIVVSNKSWDEPLVVIEGFRNVQLESLSESVPKITSVRRMGSYPRWVLDVDNSPAAALSHLQKIWAAAASPPSQIIQELERAAYIFCRRTTARFSEQDAKAFAPHHRLFYQYMQKQCERAVEGKLPCQTAAWGEFSPESEDQVLERVAAASLDGKLLCRVGANVERIFLGQVEPLEVMREDNLLHDFYHSGLSDEKTPAVAVAHIRDLSLKRPLRILEVGAGTGGATARIMEAFRGEVGSRLEVYTYTDVSGGFFDAARKEFSEWSSFFEYKILDIEKDPVAQGLQEASYDVVTAFQVLHATTKLSDVLAHCKKMLKP